MFPLRHTGDVIFCVPIWVTHDAYWVLDPCKQVGVTGSAGDRPLAASVAEMLVTGVVSPAGSVGGARPLAAGVTEPQC